MEIILTFIGGTVLVVAIAFLFRTVERIERLERALANLKSQLARIQGEKTAGESDQPAEAPLPQPETTARTGLQQRLADAKRSAGETGPIELASAPPPIPEEIEKPEKPASPEAAAPVSPPPPPLPVRKSEPGKPAPAVIPATDPPNRDEGPLIEWRPILEKLKLWPPSGENAEAAIVGWWALRGGIVTLIISAVFAGIQFSEKFPPWLWVLMLAAIAAGLTALGAWLERRLQAFGRMISAGGLALGYFTAFAAFALPAMKVIGDPVIGVFVQILALAVTIGWSFWKRDESFAAMAVLLGLVSCGFSHHHDLDHFVIAGLLLLAAGGGVTLVLRNWLWPHAIATAGSWIGFFILAIGEWSRPGEAPGFGLVLGSLLTLTAILEAANFLTEARNGDDAPATRPRERKWLAIVNTSAAISVGWLATKRVAPDHLEVFFLAFAVLMLAIAGFRYWRGHPAGLTETFFLKAVALLALFFVERFEGPTRWLSLAVEAGAVLWTFRRTGLRWVEIGFGAVFLGALGFIWKDVLDPHFQGAWKVFGIPSLAGAATLVLLSAELALHSLWSANSPPEKDAGADPIAVDPVQVFRLLAGAFTGFAAAAFTFSLAAENPEVSRTISLSLIALALAAPAIWIRRFPPVMAGLAALVPAYLAFNQFLFDLPTDLAGIYTAGGLVLLAFALAEIVFRFWETRWVAGNTVRTILYGLGALTLVELILRSEARFAFGPTVAVPVIVLFAAAGAGILIGLRRPLGNAPGAAKNPTSHTLCQGIIAALLGGFSVFIALDFLGGNQYLSAWLAIAGAVLFAAAFRTRNSVPAVAGGIPFLAGIIAHTIEFGRASELDVHLGCAALMIAVSLGTAGALWRFASPEKHPETKSYQLILQAAALFVIHWIFRSHLEVSMVFFADALLAASAVAAGLVPPFRSLPVLSSLPLALALGHIVTATFGEDWGARFFWWPTAVIVFGWIRHLHSPPPGQDPMLFKPAFHSWNSAVAAGVITLCGYHSLDNPWHLVVLTGFAMILALLWRRGKIDGLHFWSALPLGVAACGAFLRTQGIVPVDPGPGLIAISATALGIVGHGILIAFRKPNYRPLVWVHGLLALGIAFAAFAPGSLDISKLTTVCWGIAASVLFAAGVVAGLRPYRLAGLIGLGLCLVRMFLIDIEDPFFRIFAFLAIAVVLLGTGYIYHRFRDRIERFDHGESGAD